MFRRTSHIRMCAHGHICQDFPTGTCDVTCRGYNDEILSMNHSQTLCNFTSDMWNDGDFKTLKDCLQDMDLLKFLPLDNNLNWGWKITVDGYFLPDYPENLKQKRPNIPILLDLVQLQPNISDIIVNIYASHYRNDSDHLYWLKSVVDAFTGAAFTAFTARDVDFYLESNNTNVYLYEYTWQTRLGYSLYPGGWDPTFHGQESFYIWLSTELWNTTTLNFTVTPTDYELIDIFGEAWSNFVKFGNPSPDGKWRPTINKDIKEYYEIGVTQGMRHGYRLVDQW
uniref:Carboxylesterase type B domain-containing protein n=1 Tax=Acrobeloides nanus TaxID=290746 RepID=A0A914EDR6_9BILA